MMKSSYNGLLDISDCAGSLTDLYGTLNYLFCIEQNIHEDGGMIFP